VIKTLIAILLASTIWITVNSEKDLLIGVFIAVTLGIAYFTWQKKATQLSAWLKLLLAVGLLLLAYSAT
jgi:hypothetical protein